MKKDSIFLGVLIGLIAPVISYLLTTYTSMQQSLFAQKPIAMYVIAAVINLVIIRFSFKSGRDTFGKGVVLATFIAMLALIFMTKLSVG